MPTLNEHKAAHLAGARRRGQRGFTLTEILVVVVIIGILAAVSVPVYLNQRKKAWNSQTESTVDSARVALEQIFTANDDSFEGLPGETKCNNTGGAGSSNKCEILGKKTIDIPSGVTIVIEINYSRSVGYKDTYIITATNDSASGLKSCGYNSGDGAGTVCRVV